MNCIIPHPKSSDLIIVNFMEHKFENMDLLLTQAERQWSSMLCGEKCYLMSNYYGQMRLKDAHSIDQSFLLKSWHQVWTNKG